MSDRRKNIVNDSYSVSNEFLGSSWVIVFQKLTTPSHSSELDSINRGNEVYGGRRLALEKPKYAVVYQSWDLNEPQCPPSWSYSSYLDFLAVSN